MKAVEGGVTAPKAFRAAGVSAGIKKKSGTKDCALVVSDGPASVAGMFTRNVMKSPPVFWNVDVCKRGTARGVFINSGCANACTGPRGNEDVKATVDALAEGLSVDGDALAVCSTGVIGERLPLEKIRGGIARCIETLSAEGGLDAATAIMTTDTAPKEMALEVTLSAGTVRIGAMAKGSGMISPNMATLICIVTTDAAVEATLLDGLLREAVNVSFNQICIDNDMSTSDTVMCFANGASGVEAIREGSDDCRIFSEALTHMCREMAKALVRDGEGATKFVEILVKGAASEEDAKTIARTIAHSYLCKTAFFGEDPNWGRFACATGYSGVQYDPAQLTIALDNLQLVKGGMAADYKEEDAAAVMKKDSFRLEVGVGHGSGEAVFWTSDLSHEYVSINADYRS